MGFGDRQLCALTSVGTTLDAAGLGIDRIPPIEGTIALEGKVMPICFVDGDMGNISRKGPDKLTKRQSSDARKGSQTSNQLKNVLTEPEINDKRVLTAAVPIIV